jgi:hypothetical protein
MTTRAASAGTDLWIPNVGLGLGGTEAQAFSGAISETIAGAPSTLLAACNSTTQSGYVANSFSRSRTHLWNGSTATGSIRSITTFGNSGLGRCGAWQHQFNAPITKLNGFSLLLNFVTSIGRKPAT